MIYLGTASPQPFFFSWRPLAPLPPASLPLSRAYPIRHSFNLFPCAGSRMAGHHNAGGGHRGDAPGTPRPACTRLRRPPRPHPLSSPAIWLAALVTGGNPGPQSRLLTLLDPLCPRARRCCSAVPKKTAVVRPLQLNPSLYLQVLRTEFRPGRCFGWLLRHDASHARFVAAELET
jgi:hypothetical protein